MRTPLGLAALGAALLLSAAAQGDEAEDLIDDLERAVADLADTIGSMDPADERDIDSVRGDVDDIRDIVADLVPFEDAVDGLERRIDDYEDDLDRVDDALVALHGMAEIAGEIEPNVEECEEIEREFTRGLNDLAQAGNDVDDVERAGAAVGRTVQGYLDDAAATMREMERLHDEARDPGLRHDDFDDVGEEISDAADSLFAQEDASNEALQETCALLADYENHPGYIAAVTLLIDEDAAADQFVDNAEEWLAIHADLGPGLCTAMRQIRDAYCELDMEANDEDPRFSVYQSAVRDAQATFAERIDDALAHYERNLAGVGASLEGHDNVVDEFYARLRRRAAYYYRVQGSNELRNMSDMALRTWIVYGRQQHERMQDASYCHVVERYVPGSSGSMRVDCVDVAQCIVWEFKSDSPSNQTPGRQQAAGYATAINRWMEGEWDDANPIAPATNSPRPGMTFDEDFLRQAVKNYCLVDGVGQFEGELDTYPRCREDLDVLCDPQPD